jgi:hypothetical protein
VKNVDPIISCDSGAVLRLDSSKNYEAIEIAQGIDKSAMIVNNIDDSGAVTVVFNNEIQLCDFDGTLVLSHPVDENIAACIAVAGNLIYSTFDGHIISKKM